MEKDKLGKSMKVLLVSAHPDDAMVSCGGTINRLRTPSNTIYSIYFCPCMTDPKNKGLLKEHQKVCDSLGIDKLIGKKFPVNRLEEHKQEVRDILYKLREEYNPDLVLCPSTHDLHQDHKTVADCCATIFRDTSTILSYEPLRSIGPKFNPNFYVILTHLDVKKKIRAVSQYKSQLRGRPYFFKIGNFSAQMKMRGIQAKVDWAEVYELVWGRV